MIRRVPRGAWVQATHPRSGKGFRAGDGGKDLTRPFQDGHREDGLPSGCRCSSESMRREKQVKALILCPTRELALQVASEIGDLGKYKKWIHVAAIYGGALDAGPEGRPARRLTHRGGDAGAGNSITFNAGP